MELLGAIVILAMVIAGVIAFITDIRDVSIDS
jgi:hypothetical protein